MPTSKFRKLLVVFDIIVRLGNIPYNVILVAGLLFTDRLKYFRV